MNTLPMWEQGDDPVVVLTPSEMAMGANAGAQRRIYNIVKKHPPMFPSARGQWHEDIEGALAEMALAKHMGVYWQGKGSVRGPDVGDFEVRWTPWETGKLVLHEKTDKPGKRYHLVTGEYGQYTLRGWYTMEEGCRPEYWDDTQKYPQHFIPQGVLHKGIMVGEI
jgi:hypothetical protein